ncbi:MULTISPECIES: ribosome-associated translation inhibitor RaiA [Microbacterium]|uniref:ribosome hibernation-promoting factor, HPF/YfiA family n=1 Tax=Microbacterium TaxID=33882 RepID=UPI0012B6E978|nr:MULTISPECIES: ribosome-associated translation inhibitor RaiA [Microbacterium]MTE22767.1 ribosome-associated translation inhibitor RaiA [Microbacterium sp. ZXX196]NHI17438.1 ribosome-associated translation inhibitor RaiA [Microbacterium excoecariae]
MDTSIVGVGVSITDRFRTVIDEKLSRVETLAPRADRLDVKVTQSAHHRGRVEEAKVELTVTGKGKVARSEARAEDKFQALEVALDKLTTQLRRAKDKKVTDRQRPHGAHLEKGTGSLAGIDITPVDAATLHAVSTGSVPVQEEQTEEEYSPVVIRTKTFGPEWMTVEEAVDRMELVGHDFFLFVDARTDHPSVVYRRRGWDYGVISLETQAPPEEQLAS